MWNSKQTKEPSTETCSCYYLSVTNLANLPYLQYCAIVWANCSSYMLDSVYIVQKRAIRITYDLPRRAHTAPYFKQEVKVI